MQQTITVSASIAAPLKEVWEGFTNPEMVKEWNAASPDWHSPRAENDLRVGGRFNYRMEAKDGSEGFDFEGTYEVVVPPEEISYVLDDGRQVSVTFVSEGERVNVTTKFAPELENSIELQQAGWQSILDNFKRYLEAK
jgi:uncharacterized protein YndB with AHSA1/START domain